MTLVWALIVAGVVGELVVRGLVGSRRVGPWAGYGVYFPVLAALSVATGEVTWAGHVPWWIALQLGAGWAFLLFIGTRLFLKGVGDSGTFGRHLIDLYAERERLPLPAAVGLGVLVAAGEEIFWRGLVQGRLSVVVGAVAGAVLATTLSVVATAPTRSLPVIVGTAVGGVVWAGLALATGGVLASIMCHVTWTTLMLAWPPPAVAKTAGQSGELDDLDHPDDPGGAP